MRAMHRGVAAWSSLAALAVLALLALGCGSSSSSSPTTPSNGSLVTIFIKGNLGAQSYNPDPVTMRVGQQVNWKNDDTVTHTATLSGVFDTGNIPPMSAKNTPVTMNATGTFTYHCTIHPGMVGQIIVQP